MEVLANISKQVAEMDGRMGGTEERLVRVENENRRKAIQPEYDEIRRASMQPPPFLPRQAHNIYSLRYIQIHHPIRIREFNGVVYYVICHQEKFQDILKQGEILFTEIFSLCYEYRGPIQMVFNAHNASTH
ncbi:hypothetical protein H5410_003018 [Solanum commersonii]|uniref:Uncharacterized protein n=1 Tax=Solanum commersonii TaxID=4109 RepID=A0A9J6B3H4_SOLCO|nr:hypothetical protein H5410_003018 [Solanum commersonii]